MHEAFVYTSNIGPFKKRISALQVKSREHYRELFPLVSTCSSEPVTWVKAVFEGGELKRRSHFRTLSGKRKTDFIDYDNYVRHKEKIVQSAEHIKAVSLLRNVLCRLIETTKVLNWSFRDDDVSDFHFEGNVLFNAKVICEEYRIQTAFDKEFRLDVAVVGDGINNTPLVVFGVEIEKGHKFNGLKTILCKTLGFPLISIDISGMTLDEISLEWAERVMSLTTQHNEMGFRKSFVYLPPLLYPFYVRHGKRELRIGDRHCYIVFARDHELTVILSELSCVRKMLDYSAKDISISLVNGIKSGEALHQVELERQILGQGWEQLANNQCVRICLPRPVQKEGRSKLHRFYLLLSKCLLSNNALVGYKYAVGMNSSQTKASDEHWTVYQVFPGEQRRAISHRYLPKLLSSPLVEVAVKLGLL